jgi:Zn-finger nucleic acid-binding protein
VIVECPGCKGRYDVTGRAPGTRARCRCGTTFALAAPSRPTLLACPGCGAGVSPTGNRCEFCRAELLVRVCPRCFAHMFHGHRHCPGCGVAAAGPARVQPDGEPSARRCPRCPTLGSEPMVANLVGDVLVDECRGCHGIWLDAAAVDRLVRERQEKSVGAVRAHLAPPEGLATESPPPAIAAPARAYLPCPDCGALMNRSNFARSSGVMLDVCRDHGTWFDRDELRRVIDFVLGGGLEKSARKELAQVQAEVRRARAEATNLRNQGGPVDVGQSDGGIELGAGALSLIGWLLG